MKLTYIFIELQILERPLLFPNVFMMPLMKFYDQMILTLEVLGMTGILFHYPVSESFISVLLYRMS